MNLDTLTPQQIRYILQNAHKLPKEKKVQVLETIRVLTERKTAQKRRNSLLDFVLHVDKNYKVGAHHKHLAKLLEDMAFGRSDRVTVSIAPRFGKSQLTSIYFPAWFIGNFPDKKIMMISHTADLAVDFGRKVRNLVDSEPYKSVFPDVSLAPDSKSAGRWSTNKGGEYFAVGVGGALAGRGADLMCLSKETLVCSKARGMIRAGDVVVGDYIWGFAGFERVEKCFQSVHNEYYDVDGVRLTGNHPVWTFDSGWTSTDQLTTHNLVDTVSLWSYIRLFAEMLYGQAHDTWRQPHKNVQHLGADASAMQQPGGGKLHLVWSAWHKVLRAMEVVCAVFERYGAPTERHAYAGSRRHGWRLHPRELPLGGPRNASKQPKERGAYNRARGDAFCISMESKDGTHSGRDMSPRIHHGYDARASVKYREDELGAAPRSTHEFGWLKRAAVRLIGRCRKSFRSDKGVVVGGFEALIASRVFGLLVGVRRLSSVKRICGSSTEFCNFQTADSNTYYAGGLMTHNCIDDPHNEQDVLNGNYEVFDKAYDWYAFGARTRLMPGGRVAVVATRWAQNDLIGRLMQDMVRNPESDQWEVVEFPAILEKTDSDGNRAAISLWPEQWSVESLLRTKASMPPFQWNAQYMQQPTSAEAAIIKREWWQKWEKDDPPSCEYIIMSLDAAAEKNNRADFTALTTWGIFYKDDDKGAPAPNIILLNSIKERWEFPTLKSRAYEEYKEWEPDWFVVEKKSAGTALYQEMRSAGVPVQEFTPHRGSGDKTARLNSVSDIFASGMVWYPAGRRWAEEVVDEVCGFPAMPNDDLTDSTVMALMRFRTGGFIRLPGDRWDDEQFRPRKAAYY